MFKKRVQKPEQARRRPASGGGANKVFSYYASRDASEDVRRRRLRTEEERTSSLKAANAKPFLRAGSIQFVVIALIVLAAAVYNSMLTGTVSVAITGDAKARQLLQEPHVYAASAENSLDGSLFNRSKLTINTEQTEKQLVERFPELASAQIELPLVGHQPRVLIEPAAPVAIFTASDNKSYLIDETGRLVANNTLKIFDGLPAIIDQTGFTSEIGDKVLPSDDMAYLLTVAYQLKEKDIPLRSLTMPRTDAPSRQLNVYVRGKPYYVKFSFVGDALQQIGTYIALKEQLEQQKKTPKQYIDVRVGGRAYYK